MFFRKNGKMLAASIIFNQFPGSVILEMFLSTSYCQDANCENVTFMGR